MFYCVLFQKRFSTVLCRYYKPVFMHRRYKKFYTQMEGNYGMHAHETHNLISVHGFSDANGGG